MPQYCIDKSLVCNGVPNCSEDDYSDEEKCHLPMALGGVMGGLVVISLIVVVTYALRSRRRKAQRETLALQLRQLEHSPGAAARGDPDLSPVSRDSNNSGISPNVSFDSDILHFKDLRTFV
ncbi:CUB domain-containing protein [Nephila pilipes]|uniref:CUB domain-containing protein n=1 Tax=Nephila pilipes TaxID=299642 RepID=A0A8X6NP00_NEPPI|nr:CUB domain-containing protein [Nephila pilipes]